MFCNTWIKFDLFRKEALSYGYDLVATGHYARIENDTHGIYRLFRGVDMTKDQSYFLGALHGDQLQQTLFPLGDLLKTHVRQIARDIGLPNAERKDSQ